MRYDNVSMTNSRAAHAPGSADPASAGQQSGMAELPRARSSVPAPAPLPKRCAQCGARYPADFRVCPRDALELEDAPAADDPLLGQTLCGTYRLVRIIGEGGMGRVYEAQNSRLSAKRYALKLLHAELARKSEVIARFQREAEAVSGLIHPNVVAVHDVNFTNDGRPFIVAELLEGEDLGSLLDRVGKLASSQAVEIVRRVCDGLAAAHARGIVHRDMKPENVFLSGNSSSRSRFSTSAFRSWPKIRNSSPAPESCWARRRTWLPNKRAVIGSMNAPTSTRSARSCTAP
jgi:serine/threonine protein kinase